MAGSGASWCLKKIGGNTTKYGLIPLKNGEEVSIGRGMDVTVQLLASKNLLTLSRKHCIFKQSDDGSWTVTDNKSLNGVFINDTKIIPLQPASLKEKDKLELGKKPSPGEDNEFIYSVTRLEQSREEVDKLLRAWKRKAEKFKQRMAAKAPERGDSEACVRSESQAGGGSWDGASLCDRKRKERLDEDAIPDSSSCVTDVNKPSTSSGSSAKRTRVSYESEKHDFKNSGFRKLMEQLGSNMSSSEMVALTDLLTGAEGQSVLERLKSKSKKQEEAEENARLEEVYKSRVEEKEEELKKKDEELMKQRRLQEEALEKQKQLLKEKEEALVRMQQEMQTVLETHVKEKETALMEQLTQQREELLNEKQKVEDTLQEEFSKQLAEKDRSLKAEQESMRGKLEEAIREKEAQMLAQLEAQKQALIEEKRKVEENLHTALEKDKGLEEEKQRLDEIIQKKEKEKEEMEAAMESGRQKREQEEKQKIEMAKQAALDDFTMVMENELQCSICSELFIQATTLNCSHSFCSYCIMMWLKRKKECPVCRASTTSHNRSIVLDNYIDKMIERLGDEFKQSRKEILQERSGCR